MPRLYFHIEQKVKREFTHTNTRTDLKMATIKDGEQFQPENKINRLLDSYYLLFSRLQLIF